MLLKKINLFLKKPLSVAIFYLFERWVTKDKRRVLSTNLYIKIARFINLREYNITLKARKAFLTEFQRLHASSTPKDFMADGWSLFPENYFPYTREVVATGKAIFEKVGRDNSRKVMPYHIADIDELLAIEEFYKFAFSEKLIAHAAEYIGEYPVLANMALLRSDPTSNDIWIGSQNFHLDIISKKVFRVVVLIDEMNQQNGPFTFYPASVSKKIRSDKNIKYGYSLTSPTIKDEELKDYPDHQQVQIIGEGGEVLTVDTCNCFHLGSRAKSESRCVLMLSYTSPILDNLRDAMGLDKSVAITESEPMHIKLAKSKNYSYN